MTDKYPNSGYRFDNAHLDMICGYITDNYGNVIDIQDIVWSPIHFCDVLTYKYHEEH